MHRRAVATYVAAAVRVRAARDHRCRACRESSTSGAAKQLADLDLTAGEWAVLTSLAKAGEALTPSQLADLTNVAPSSMTHRLDKLAQRGLVERTPDAVNRTRIFVSLTDAGWELFSLAIRDSEVVESDVLKDLGDADRGELARLLEVVIARLDDIDA